MQSAIRGVCMCGEGASRFEELQRQNAGLRRRRRLALERVNGAAPLLRKSGCQLLVRDVARLAQPVAQPAPATFTLQAKRLTEAVLRQHTVSDEEQAQRNAVTPRFIGDRHRKQREQAAREPSRARNGCGAGRIPRRNAGPGVPASALEAPSSAYCFLPLWT